MTSTTRSGEMHLDSTQNFSEGSGSQPSYNPFEVDICSLSLPACSPDVFSLRGNKTPKNCDRDESFRWSISQVAALKPANIDETSCQTTMERWDEEKEFRAQKAIETFFLHNSICPSPWNGAMTFKHVSFSPHLASTAYYSKSNSPFNACGTDDTTGSSGKRDVWTQTTLAIPMEVDLFQLLGYFFTFLEDQKNQRFSEDSDLTNDAKDFSNSSLRRKLFSPNRLQREDCSNECGSVPLSTSPLKFYTPEKSLRCKFQPTPSSAGTYFSSSPISAKNYSISSSPLECNMSSPPVSPICSPSIQECILKKNPTSCDRNKQVAEHKFLPSTPCKNTNKVDIVKSILKCSNTEVIPVIYKQSPLAKPYTKEIIPNDTQEFEIVAEHTQYNSTQSSEMQISVLQDFSVEHGSNHMAEVSVYHHPSSLSQDTGYKTQSYQHSMDTGLETECANPNFSGRKGENMPKWQRSCQNDKAKDSLIQTSDSIQANTKGLMDSIDSALISQSNWNPNIFSTPH